MSLVRNKPTPEGEQLGEQIVRLYGPAIAKLEAAGFPDQRCSTCAFRPGTLPNGSPTTTMDVMKCLLERHPFGCHDAKRKGELCWGYHAHVVDTPDATPRKCPWPFSDEAEPEPSKAQGSPSLSSS